MNKTELVRELRKRLHISEEESIKCVEALTDILTEKLKDNEAIGLRGFGSIYPHQQRARPARNPKTGTPCLIPPRTTVKFHPGKDLLKTLNVD